MVDEQYYKTYMGDTAPENFKRLLNIAISTLSSLNTVDMSSYCEDVYKNALCEQVNYLSISNIDEVNTVESIRLGDASESYKTKTGYDNAISPIAKQLLKDNKCNFYYGGMRKQRGGCCGF